MAIKIQMPKLADTMTEGVLVKWRKKVGDKIEAGEVLAEVETDKATMEMEVFDDGVLSKLLVEEGAKVPVGENIAILTEEGDAEGAGEEAEPEKKAEAAPKAKTAAPAEAKSEKAPAPAAEKAAPAPAKSDERVKASPLARKVAAAAGIDLSTLQGTGPGGRIVAQDVEKAPKGGSTPPPAAKSAPLKAAAADKTVALSGMRKTIAQRLLESKTTVPHFYLHVEIDAAPLVRVRSEVNAAGEKDGVKLTFNDFVVKAVAVALARLPKVNASFNGDSIIEYGAVNVAVAVAIDDGLVTPVIRDANTKSIVELSATVKDLAARARNKKLKPDEYQGGTFTISNLGAYGIDSFDAIINPPQSGILSVANIVKKPVVGENDQIVVGQRMDLGLSADHRVVDGAIAAQFLAELKKLLENPSYLLM